ncbi:MAG: amidophosphoribosyltransferase [Candidatus ainarchaeum sp.]|nr:amidophosphoribosyltransferase [Candidatus ainarchaeum sp.]
MDDEKHEECGVIGIYSKKSQPVAPLLYRAMVALQHRGQDAAGFAVHHNGKFETRRGLGLVYDIFSEEDQRLEGAVGIGHTRYPTTGRCLISDVQPSAGATTVVSHNGHISNYWDLRKEFEKEGVKMASQVDSEIILLLLQKKIGEGLESAVKYAMERLDGAYSVAGIYDGKLFAFRDRHAIRPLVYGENRDFFCICSESCALDTNNIPYAGEVRGGEMIVVENGKAAKKQLLDGAVHNCMFEYVYFARPDSIINKKWVYQVRKRLGEELAAEHPVKADIVVPVPDTSRTAAQAFSEKIGLRLEEGLIKNRYIGRTFIMPNQGARANAVKLKLNPVRPMLEGKRVVLIDDSIVRGTTLKEIVGMVRGAGAAEVHLRITSPPIRAPCFYGVDMSTYSELIANKKSVEEIRNFLGADSLGYLSLDGLKKAIGLPLCTGCLNEDYPTEYAKKLAMEDREHSG